MPVTDRSRSSTQGAKTSRRTRLASSRLNVPGVAGSNAIGNHPPARFNLHPRLQPALAKHDLVPHLQVVRELVPDLKIAGPGPYDGIPWGEVFPNVSSTCLDRQRDRRGVDAQRLYQMRPDLGRLVSVPEILPIRPPLSEGGIVPCLAQQAAR